MAQGKRSGALGKEPKMNASGGRVPISSCPSLAPANPIESIGVFDVLRNHLPD
jgi:hypothetical protein